MTKLANLISTIICVTGLVILSAAGAQSQNPPTTGALLTINGTVTDGTNSTPVNVSISDKDIVAVSSQPTVPVASSGNASTCTAADQVQTAGYVLQAAAATGCDPGDTFEGTILDGSATLSSTSGAVAYTFNITTHYQCGQNEGSCSASAITNTNKTITSGDTGFLTVTNNGPTNTYFVGTIQLEGTPGPSPAALSGCTAGQPLIDSLTFTSGSPFLGPQQPAPSGPVSQGEFVVLALASDSSGCGGFSGPIINTYTTSPQTTTAGGSNQFKDPGPSGTIQTYVFPTTTTFEDDNNNACSTTTPPTMAIQFQYWDPASFNKGRLPGVAQTPNWCSSPTDPGLACSTPVPAQTTCAQLSVNGKNYCIVEEAQCTCNGAQLAQCNVDGGASGILVSNAGASPTATNPGLVIGDDGQNNWAVMAQSPDGATCTTNCSTQKLNTDITILDVNQPDFSFSASPSTLNPSVGGSATSTVSVSWVYGLSSQVALSVPNPPAGVITSFSSTSLTPLVSPPSPMTSTLTVTPLTTGSFTLNVNGVSTPIENGVPVTLNHYAFVTVNVAANTSTSGISNVITTLLNNNCIDNAGIANALTSKLSAAQSFISAGGNNDAINTLTALNNQINAQSGKHIHTTCTISGSIFNPVTILTTDVQTLINSLRVGLLGDPITGYALNSSGAGIQGATVSILSGGSSIATATTDITGFYYFATTNLLTTMPPGNSYTIEVTGFAGYSTAVPTSSPFTWSGTLQNFNFTLN